MAKIIKYNNIVHDLSDFNGCPQKTALCPLVMYDGHIHKVSWCKIDEMLFPQLSPNLSTQMSPLLALDTSSNLQRCLFLLPRNTRACDKQPVTLFLCSGLAGKEAGCGRTHVDNDFWLFTLGEMS